MVTHICLRLVSILLKQYFKVDRNPLGGTSTNVLFR